MPECIERGTLDQKDKSLSLIMRSARHATVKGALLYIQDIAQRLAKSVALEITDNKVRCWHPINLMTKLVTIILKTC